MARSGVQAALLGVALFPPPAAGAGVLAARIARVHGSQPIDG